MTDSQDSGRRAEILRGRAERQAYSRPRVPWYAKVWNWFMPGTYRASDERRNATVVIGICVVAAALIGLIAYNLVLRPVAGNAKIVVADGVYATGQESNIIENFESQGFHDVAVEDGLGVVAYGTPEMVAQYRESFGSQYLDEATEVLGAQYEDVGIAAVSHSEGWDTISITTYTNEVDVDLFQFILTKNQDVTNALEEWIAWGTMQNAAPVSVEMLDGTGSRYFKADGISSVADILEETRNSNPKGVDWDSVTESLEKGSGESDATDVPETEGDAGGDGTE